MSTLEIAAATVGPSGQSSQPRRRHHWSGSLACRRLRARGLSHQWTFPVNTTAAARFEKKDAPTAILATDSLVALSALAAARKAGLHISDDLSVSTFDNSPWSGGFERALSVVSQPVRELGALAARMVMQRVNGLDDPAREVQLPSVLIARQSSRQAPHLRVTS
ncbi:MULTISPECIES: substrate-binding domain-containing protein [unclassified Microbacterium]|uniref:substrate-binding domain-containing protein n=1 Tax=unclassified Microbacterium TaxID=2609290 RepID=UPI000C2C2E81